MGYELVFHYKEAGEQPGSYKEEVKNKSYKIGKVTEDVSLDVVAAKIMAQLARRNILIIDVEIYEYAKKKLSYRETTDGIVLKNKKFSFDSRSVVLTEEFEEDAQPQPDFKPIPSPSKELADKSCPLAKTNLVKRAIRQEIYDPDPIGKQKVSQKGLKFTVGKRYSIYSEESMGSTLVYDTTDDSGRNVKVSSEYFVAIGAGLIEAEQPNYVGAENQKHEIDLWKNYEQVEMPDIRRK
jgi:hypothetical protein